MATIMHLPPEVISIILCEENISFKDVMSFALTCKQFYDIRNDNAFWRKKFYQRWPYLRDEYEKQLQYRRKINFLKQIKTGLKSKEELWHYMSLMSEKYYYKSRKHNAVYDLFDVDLKNLHSLFDPRKGAYFMNYYFFVNELIRFLAQSRFDKKSDLTQRYCAKRLLLYLHHYRLRNRWHKFKNNSKEKQILEEAATILAQCYQPEKNVSCLYVRRSLDNIAQQVLEYLKIKHPTHSIFSISAKQFSVWKYNNINDNHWNRREGIQILESLCKVLYDKLGFRGNLDQIQNYEETFIPESAFIDYVLEHKCGTGVPLAIIYHSVARRLGIRCDLVSSPFCFYLCWRPKYHTTNFKDKECFYIDILHHGSTDSDDMIVSATKMKSIKWRSLNKYEYEKISRVEIMSGMGNYFEVHKKLETRAMEIKQKNKDADKIVMLQSFLNLKCLINQVEKQLLI